MQPMTKLWTQTPLNKKMAIIYLMITLATSLIVGLVSYHLSKQIITRSSIEKSQDAVKAVASSVNTFFNAADNTFISIFSNHNLRDYLEHTEMDKGHQEQARRDISAAVSLARQLNNSVIYINIFGSQAFNYTDYYFNSETNRDYHACVSYYEPFGLTDDRKSALWVPNQNAVIGLSNTRLITLVRYTRDIYTLDITGIMTMGVSEASLCKLFQSSNMFIADSDGSILSHYDKKLIGSKLPYASIRESLTNDQKIGTVSFLTDDQDRFFATYSQIPETGWYLISIEDYYQTFQSSYQLKNSIAAILLSSIFISAIILIFVSKALTASLSRLLATMDRAMSGDLSVRFDVTSSDDVNKIGIYLNKMLKQISENIDYREKSERLARLSELRLLQSQINPHLLYNTLDSVHYRLETADYQQASDVLKTMSRFFKLSLSQGDYLIPIEKELSLVRYYLEIQRMCREKNIELIIHCDSSLLQMKVPKMIIQPIVENSILHGLGDDHAHGRIIIDVEKSNDSTVVITVSDDGIGMTYEQADKINDAINSLHNGFEQKHYGLWNINHRLKDVFGDCSGLTIQSEFGEYTKTVIVICNITERDQE